ncbi:4024_t:CDS:2, partial [Rhizophagus irregularis]
SVATEGVEMSFEETRETRRISTINQNSVGAPILEAIHAKYNADRVGNDLFIKEAIHRRLANLAEAHNPARYVVNHGICIVRGIERRPDVGVLPDVWVDVIVLNLYLGKMITHAQQHWIGIEYIGIAIPESIRRNPNPQQASVAVIAQNNISNRPLYAIHWDANNNQIYYPYNWNTHLLLRCGWTL